MQFLVLAKDGVDSEALNRRMAAREEHLTLSEEAAKRGEQLVAAALLSGEQMAGSVMIVDFPSQKELQAWLEEEPYVTGNVWEQIDIIPCKIGPSFEHILNNKEKE
jgi:uncharacterized protein YciI